MATPVLVEFDSSVTGENIQLACALAQARISATKSVHYVQNVSTEGPEGAVLIGLGSRHPEWQFQIRPEDEPFIDPKGTYERVTIQHVEWPDRENESTSSDELIAENMEVFRITFVEMLESLLSK